MGNRTGGKYGTEEYNAANQSSSTKYDSISPQNVTMPDGSETNIRYDAWGNLTQFDPHNGHTDAIHYDALGREIIYQSDSTRRHDYYDGVREIEERSGGLVQSQWVWSAAGVPVVVVLRDRNADKNINTGFWGKNYSGLEERTYALEDAANNVTAITNAAGSVLEHYLYTPEGKLEVRNANYTVSSSATPSLNWRYTYQSGRADGAGIYRIGSKEVDYLTGGTLLYDPLAYAADRAGYSEWTARNSEVIMSDTMQSWVKWLRVGGTAALAVATLGSSLLASGIVTSTEVAIAAGIGYTGAAAAVGGAIGGYVGRESGESWSWSGAATGAEWGMNAVSVVGGIWGSAARATGQGLACRMASGTFSGLTGGGIGAGFGFASGYSETWGRYGNSELAMQAGLHGAMWGGIFGFGVGFAHGLASPYVCFVAGTQVVVGLKIEEDDGRIKEITARELPTEKQGDGVVATAMKIVGYVTANIEDLVANGGGEMGVGSGQFVISRDQNDPSGPLVSRRISRTYKRTAHALQILTLRDSGGCEQTLKVTDEHPFYVQFAGWTPAKSLQPNDTILGTDGTLTVVSNETEQHPQGVTVYNLEVEQAHTYFVLAEDANDAAAVWVHNAEGYTHLNDRRLADGRVSSKYQEHVTGKSYEEYWQTPGGKKGIDGRVAGYLVEAKWAGRDNVAYASDKFYNPAGKYYDESFILDQARGYLAMDEAMGGNGVRYGLSNDAARAHFASLFQQHFPDAMSSGQLRLYHVPGNGMK